MPWQTGDQIVLRIWVGGAPRPTGGYPCTVVRDDPDCIAVLLAAGTPVKRPVNLDGTEIPRTISFEERHNLPKRTGDGVWHTNSRLLIARPGAAHSYSYFWIAEDWTPLGWYVDLHAPLRRTSIGFDSEDYVLDLLVNDDLSWSWKDEDEFADAIRLDRFTATQAAEIRAEGERAIAIIEAGGWPFNAGWEAWRPDPSWRIPSVPDGWDRV